MISPADLRRLARARLKDVEVLLAGKRLEGGAYLCGYAVELALKARICRTLKWGGYPYSAKEFRELGSFKTHDLSMLLSLSGQEGRVKTQFFAEWSAVNTWSPEVRYRVGAATTAAQLQLMLAAAKTILGKL